MAYSASFTKLPGVSAGRRVASRTPLRVRAQEVETDSKSGAGADFFKANSRARTGYLEEDSAGQTNVFAVQPKQYVQGSSYDATTGDIDNTAFGVGGAMIGLAVVGLGVTALTSLGGDEPEAVIKGLSEYETLSQYKVKFEASLSAPEL